jgi:ABC-type thiamin/hydroxymethylpyrimidine transport system permease subunit
MTITASILLDYLTGGYYASLLPSQNYVVWLYVNCLTSAIAGLMIGFLLVTQMMTAVENITTLESFTEGIRERVSLRLL